MSLRIIVCDQVRLKVACSRTTFGEMPDKNQQFELCVQQRLLSAHFPGGMMRAKTLSYPFVHSKDSDPCDQTGQVASLI